MSTNQIKNANLFFATITKHLKKNGINTKVYEKKWTTKSDKEKVEWLKTRDLMYREMMLNVELEHEVEKELESIQEVNDLIDYKERKEKLIKSGNIELFLEQFGR